MNKKIKYSVHPAVASHGWMDGDPAAYLKAAGRLMDTGGFAKKDRITHRFAISSVEEIDDEVKKWLKKAYELDGK